MKHTFSTARLLSFVMVLAVLLTAGIVLGINASAEDTAAKTVEVGTASDLVTLLSGGTLADGTALVDGDTVALTANIALAETATVTVANTVTITSKEGAEGAPFTITRSTTTGFSMLTLTANKTVTLTNVTLDGGGYADTTSSGGAIQFVSKSTLVLDNGTTIQNFRAKQGGALQGGGTLIILDGALITGNQCSSHGSAIRTGGYVWMVGGEISGNTGTNKYSGNWGAAISLDSGRLYMYGGSITGNTNAIANNSTTASYGTAVGLANSALFHMQGGTITGNQTYNGTNVLSNATVFVSSTKSWSLKIGENVISAAPPAIVEDALAARTETPTIQFHSNESSEGTKTFSYVGRNIGFAPATTEIDTRFVITTLPEGSRMDYVESGITTGETTTTYYGVLADALAAIGEGGTLNITKAFGSVPVTLPAMAFTVNGGGNTLYRVTAGTPMFALPAGADVTFTNIALDGSKVTEDNTANGGAFNAAAGATLTLNGDAAVQKFTASEGGAIYSAGAVVVDGATISNNLSYGSGGAFVVMTGGTLTVNSGSLISQNHGTVYGGAIFADEGTVVVLNGGKVTENVVDDELASKASTCFGGGIYAKGLLVINGGEISYNINRSVQGGTFSNGGGVYMAGETSAFWMTDGKIIGNELHGRSGGGLGLAGGVSYILGGEISENLMNLKVSSQTQYGGDAIYLTGTLYLLGGTICDNDTLHKDNAPSNAGAPKEIFLSGESAKVYLGSSMIVDSIPEGVNLGENITVDTETNTVTSVNAIVMDNADTRNFAFYNATVAQIILKNDLPANSNIVLDERDATLDYFIALGEGYTAPDADTLAAFKFGVVTDALYGGDTAVVNEAGNGLTWANADKAYKIVVSAALGSDIGFRVAFARRDPADETALDGVTVEQVTNVLNKETGLWTSKQATAEWTTGTYNGSPCIVVSLAPKMAMDQITVKKDGEVVNKDGVAYTFASYLKGMKENEQYNVDAELMALVDATLNYCAAAQTYFNYNAETLANVGVETTVGTISEVTMTINDPNKIFHSAQVDVASTVSVAIIAKGNPTPTVKVGGVEVSYTLEDLKDSNNETYTAIVIPDLTAATLMQDITVEIDGATLTYSVPAYAYRIQQKSDDAELVSIVQALYAYAVAADAYAN